MDFEDKLIFHMDLELIASELSPRDAYIFQMWSEGHTLQEIANEVGPIFNQRTAENPLTCRAIGARLQKILETIRKKGIV